MAEIVLLTASDFLSLYTLPIFVRGQKLQIVPYFNLGMDIDHFFEIYESYVKFEFNPLVVDPKTLIGTLQSFSSTQLTLRTKLSSQKVSINRNGNGSNLEKKEIKTFQIIIENLNDLGREFKISLESLGFSGHFYDFPIAWVDQKTIYNSEAFDKIMSKMTRKAFMEVNCLRSKSLKITQEFFDPHANNHAKSIYRKLNLSRVKTSSEFYSFERNSCFINAALQISKKTKLKKHQRRLPGARELPKNFDTKSAPDFKSENSYNLLLQGEIDLVTCISMDAEDRKRKIFRLNRKIDSARFPEEQPFLQNESSSPRDRLVQMLRAKELLILEVQSKALDDEQKEILKKRISQIKKAEYKWKYRERKRRKKSKLTNSRNQDECIDRMKLKGGGYDVSSNSFNSSSCSLVEGTSKKERKGSH